MFADNPSDLNRSNQSATYDRGPYAKYVATGFLVLFLVAQYFQVHFGWNIAGSIGIDTDAITIDGEYWRFLTYMWFHDYLALMLANFAGILLLGPLVEGKWGFRTFFSYFFFCSFLAGLSSFLFADPKAGLIGATGGVLGLCLVNFLQFPDRKLFDLVPIRYGIWVIGALLVTVHYFVPDNGGDTNAALAQLGGFLGGWLWITLSPYVQSWYDRWQQYRRRRRRQKRSEMRRKVDRLLEKISREGIDELTWREKNILEKASSYFDEDSPDDEA